MKGNKYKMEDISIGDEIFFVSPTQSNHDLYWEVIDKMENEKKLIVRLVEMGYKDLRWSVDISQVIQHTKRNK